MSKGSKRRPENAEKVRAEYERIFEKKAPPRRPDDEPAKGARDG